MSKTRNKRRAEKGDFLLYLYPDDVSNGWRVVRSVLFAKGMEMVTIGRWDLHLDAEGFPFYFQIRSKTDQARSKIDQGMLSPKHSSSAITARESKMNAGLYGESITALGRLGPQRPFGG
jgi:hypothetical protein